ncbi:MAG: VOC family protein [Acidimicrobiia bacterium]|nr:VOC family protein [Acidimicrobiia bacterium]MBT8248883.1 VOC family protein [Acidimicrobiia bacterium]NND12935.1 VOC family protein [Acidimicrobiia bacterium]NNL27057.1 VOC family protein [Acidimicrobiia bacterium]
MNDSLITFIYVRDLKRSDSFYRETLGLTLATEQPTCRIYRITATAFLGICVRQDPQEAGGVTITLVRDDVDEFCDLLQSRGVVLEHPPAHNERFNIYHAFFRDPDGYLIEIQRFDDPNWAGSAT